MKRVINISILSAALLLLCVASGCRDVPDVRTDPGQMRRVTDDLGRSVTIPLVIKRAVSLAPNLTENIFAVGGGDRLVGVTTFCNYPEAAKGVAKIGDTLNPNMETIVALRPDIVFVSTASQVEAFLKTLEQNGTAVYVTNPDSLDGVLQNLTQLGELFGTNVQADKLVGDLQKRIDALRAYSDAKTRKTAFVQISREPLFTIGKQSFLTAALENAGAESVTAAVETAYPKLSKETALALNPDFIILSESDDNREPNEIFKNTAAVKNDRVVSINADLLSRPGPRLVDALEHIAAALDKN